MKAGFIEKLIERFDKLDQRYLQVQFINLVKEHGLLETIFQSIQEGVVVVDEEGRLTYANKAAENFIGFSFESSQGKPVCRYIREFSWDDISQQETEEWSRLISKEIEVSYPQHRYLSFYVVPIRMDGKKKGAVIILRDITRDKQAESANVESERINAIKLLAAGVAHEIGNPLNSLNIHLQLIARNLQKLPEEERKNISDLLNVARNEVSRLDMIITQFLRAIRPAKLKLALVKVEMVVKETLDLLRHQIEDKKISVEIICPSQIPAIKADRNQLKQAFFNIIRNSLQAMNNGGSIVININASDQYAIIRFRDSGKGIESENMSRIFEPYFTTKSEGTGLGLMIVQRIIQDHGGFIEVASKPGEGTSMTVYLPLSERNIRLLKGESEKTMLPPETTVREKRRSKNQKKREW